MQMADEDRPHATIVIDESGTFKLNAATAIDMSGGKMRLGKR